MRLTGPLMQSPVVQSPLGLRTTIARSWSVRTGAPDVEHLGTLCKALKGMEGGFYEHKRFRLTATHTKGMLIYLLERAVEQGDAFRLTAQDRAVIGRVCGKLGLEGSVEEQRTELLRRLKDPNALEATVVHEYAALLQAFGDVGLVSRNHKLSDQACHAVAAATRVALRALPPGSFHADKLRETFLTLAKAVKGDDTSLADLECVFGPASSRSSFNAFVRRMATSPQNLRFGDSHANSAIQARLDGNLRHGHDSFTPQSNEIQMALNGLAEAAEAAEARMKELGTLQPVPLLKIVRSACSAVGSSSISGPTPIGSVNPSPLKAPGRALAAGGLWVVP